MNETFRVVVNECSQRILECFSWLFGTGEMAWLCMVEDDGAGGRWLRRKCSQEQVFRISVSMVWAIHRSTHDLTQ